MKFSDEVEARKYMMLLQERTRLEAMTSFPAFLRYINPKYQMEWFHKVIAEHCERLLRGDIRKLMIFMPPQHGKALSVETPILTENRGWCKHGDLRVGDYVFAPDGRAVMVEAVTQQYQCESSVILFAEGNPIIAANQHEWGCYIPNSSHKAVYYPRIETQDIWRKTRGRRPYLRTAEPLKYHDKELRNKTTQYRAVKRKHFIKEIIPCGNCIVNCIQVEGGYYLAGRELRPTHNSEIVSRNFPAWALGQNPDLRIVGCSYTIDLASQFSRSIQRTLDSKEYQDIFPETYLNGSNVRSNTRGYLRNVDIFETVNHRGFYKAVGVGGGLTGTPVDIAIIDDPVKDAAEAYSSTYRERVWSWYNSVLTTRLHNDSKQLFIMTRWHEDDLAGRLLKAESDDWTMLSIPAICEVEGDGGWSDRHIGDALWEDRHSLEKLRAQEQRSARTFAALYQQHPTIQGGNIVKSSWFRSVSLEEFERLHHFEPIVFFIDTAYTDDSMNDPTGIIAACRIGHDLYIVHGDKVHLKFPDLCRYIPEYCRAHGYTSHSSIRIEPKANGLSVIDQLKELTGLNVVKTPSPKDSKETRLNVVSPSIEGGHVVLVDGSWNEAYIDEVCGFPAKPHDEYVDVTCYAIDYFLTRPARPFNFAQLANKAY